MQKLILAQMQKLILDPHLILDPYVSTTAGCLPFARGRLQARGRVCVPLGRQARVPLPNPDGGFRSRLAARAGATLRAQPLTPGRR